MVNFINLGAFLALCCIFTSVHYATSAPSVLKISILHDESQRLVQGQPSQGQVTANGGYGDTGVKFYDHRINGYHAYESVNSPGNYLLMDANGRVTLGPLDPNEEVYKYRFAVVPAGSGQIVHLRAVTTSGSTCYLAFNVEGNQLANPCDPLSALALEQAKHQIIVSY